VRRTGGGKIRCDEAEEALPTSDPGGGGLDLETGGRDAAVIGVGEWGHDVGQWGVVPFIWSRGLGFGGGVVVGWPEWPRLLGYLDHAVLGLAWQASRAD
jgi:hypothetical protein